MFLNEGGTWDLGEERNRIKPYLARQIYLQIMADRANEKGKIKSMNPELIITYLSGQYLSIDAKYSSAENYQADIKIEDLEEITKFWKWSVNLTKAELDSIKPITTTTK